MNKSESFNEKYHSIEQILLIVIPIVFGFIVLVGGIGNLLVVVVVWSNKQMRNTTNILIVSLAVADLLFIVFSAPFTGVGYVSKVWPFGDFVCKFSNYVTFVTAYASVYTLTLMAFDRYLAVVHAIRSMTMRTDRNALIVITIMWTLSLALNYGNFINFFVKEFPFNGENRSSCVSTVVIDPHKGQQFYLTFFMCGYAVPLFFICLMYGLMLKRLLYGVVPGGAQSAESIRSKKRVAKLVVIVVVVFALCWLPFHIIMLLAYFHDKKIKATEEFVLSKITFNCLAYTNSSSTPCFTLSCQKLSVRASTSYFVALVVQRTYDTTAVIEATPLQLGQWN